MPEAEGRAFALSLGLDAADWKRAVSLLGRLPTRTEIGIVSATWNEHCSYKSSKRWLKTLPTEGRRVLQGPGGNAGAVDIGNGQAVVFKIESHNHPSFIEPRQGAATGVGGILRDVFAMGARPIAAMNALFFGNPMLPRSLRLLEGCVAGIGGYGNSFGVPTVGGMLAFDSAYDGNCLVNAFAAGIVEQDRIWTAKASGAGLAVLYVGAGTGRDGVGGASMASASFEDGVEDLRPTVQVGDPFTEKRLLEALMELMATGAPVAIQDMGAAGLTCSAVEMGASAGLGMRLDLDRVPCRDEGLDALEIMLSESQERMMLILQPQRIPEARSIFEKWELECATIGQTLAADRLEVWHRGQMQAGFPLRSLVDSVPELDRPWVIRPAADRDADLPASDLSAGEALLRLFGSPALASRRWVWEQYDCRVMADTVLGPGADAAVVRVHGSNRGLAFTLDGNPHYCAGDPRSGGRQAVAEACRNLRAVGAEPLAVTNCLNFGNPESPETMGQFVGCVLGMGEACRALGIPVVSGNVSLYNQTGDRSVLPTPVIGAVGLIEDLARTVRPDGLADGQTLLLLGGAAGHLHRSLFARALLERCDGPPPTVDLDAERQLGESLQALVKAGCVAACHDLSEGGLAAAAGEMALDGGCGIELAPPEDGVRPHAWWFAEDQGRVLVAVQRRKLSESLRVLAARDIPVRQVGETRADDVLDLGGERLPLAELRRAREAWLPERMAAPPNRPG